MFSLTLCSGASWKMVLCGLRGVYGSERGQAGDGGCCPVLLVWWHVSCSTLCESIASRLMLLLRRRRWWWLLVHVQVHKETADAVIIAVPHGCLKEGDVSFRPPLPLWKASAIDGLCAGLTNRVALVFPRSFWDALAALPADGGGDPERSNVDFFERLPALGCEDRGSTFSLSTLPLHFYAAHLSMLCNVHGLGAVVIVILRVRACVRVRCALVLLLPERHRCPGVGRSDGRWSRGRRRIG